MIKAFLSEIEEKSDAERSVVAKITTNDVDRYGDIVEPSGMDAKNYEKNPVVLLNHNSYGLPVGRSAWLKVQANDVKSKTIFADTALGSDLYSLCSGGFMNGRSIGFVPKTIEQGDGKKVRQRITAWELWEYSIVTIPANPNALQKMAECESPEMKSFYDEYKKDSELIENIERLNALLLQKDGDIKEMKERFCELERKIAEQPIQKQNRLATLAAPIIDAEKLKARVVETLGRM